MTITVQTPITNTVTVASIQMNPKTAGKNYYAQAVVTVLDRDTIPVAGAVVHGDWFINGTNVSSVISIGTAVDGTVALDSPRQRTAGQTYRFVVTDVVLAGYAYTPGTVTEGSITVP